MPAASGLFAYQLIQAIAASGFLVLADADHSMLALYQAFAFGCLARQARGPQHLDLLPGRIADR